MTAPYDGILRTGRRNPLALYLQVGSGPADTDLSVGWATTPEWARLACDAHNSGTRIPGAWASGRLVYGGPGAWLTGDWVVSVASPEIAHRIVNGVTS